MYFNVCRISSCSPAIVLLLRYFFGIITVSFWVYKSILCITSRRLRAYATYSLSLIIILHYCHCITIRPLPPPRRHFFLVSSHFPQFHHPNLQFHLHSLQLLSGVISPLFWSTPHFRPTQAIHSPTSSLFLIVGHPGVPLNPRAQPKNILIFRPLVSDRNWVIEHLTQSIIEHWLDID